MLKINTLFILVFLALNILRAQTTASLDEEYIPLEIGNKWYYCYYPANAECNGKITTIWEVTGIEKIYGKKYFVIELTKPNDKNYTPYNFYQRVSNDTLFTLNYDSHFNKYVERIDAIFSLDSGDVAHYRSVVEDTSSNQIERLPVPNYKIIVNNKDFETIEFYMDTPMIDGDYSATYKKGVGLIKTKNEWGIVSELVKYELSN